MPLTIGILGAAGIAPAAVIRPARRRDRRHRRGGGRIAARALRSATPGEHGIPRAHASYEALLADDAVDLVYIALPPSAHAEWTIAALEAGKDVLCEKPFTMTAAEAEAVVEAADRTGHRVIEAFHDHYHPLEAAVRDLVASGRLGTVRSVAAVFDGSNPYDASSIRHVPALGRRRADGPRVLPRALGAVAVRRARRAARLVRPEPARRRPVDRGRARASPAGSPAPSRPAWWTASPSAPSWRSWATPDGCASSNLVFPSQGHSIRLEADGLPRTWTVAGQETYDHQLDAVVERARRRHRAADGGPGPGPDHARPRRRPCRRGDGVAAARARVGDRQRQSRAAGRIRGAPPPEPARGCGPTSPRRPRARRSPPGGPPPTNAGTSNSPSPGGSRRSKVSSNSVPSQTAAPSDSSTAAISSTGSVGSTCSYGSPARTRCHGSSMRPSAGWASVGEEGDRLAGEVERGPGTGLERDPGAVVARLIREQPQLARRRRVVAGVAEVPASDLDVPRAERRCGAEQPVAHHVRLRTPRARRSTSR